jgi:hypothetical protein
MVSRRSIIRIFAATATVALGTATVRQVRAQAPPIPLLHEGEPKAVELRYTMKSKTANTCVKCANYTALAAFPGTGICRLIDNRRVMAGGLSNGFKPR